MIQKQAQAVVERERRAISQAFYWQLIRGGNGSSGKL
jgi:hypothetical protein